MTILEGDIKLLAAKVMDDVPECGGGPSGTVIADGASNAWISRAVCQQLQAWAALPGATFTLVLRGQTWSVMFDQSQGSGFEATPVWRLADGQESPDQVFLPQLRFVTVAP